MFKLWQQIKMYKNLLVGFWLMTVFCFFACAIVSYNYFTTPHEELSNYLVNQNQLQDLQTKVYQFDEKSTDTDLFYINNALLKQKLELSKKLPLDKESLLELKNSIISQTNKKYQESFEKNQSLAKDYADKQFQLLLIGVLSFFFGILFPLLILQLMFKAGMLATEKTEDHVKAWVIQWQQENKNYNEPFKSPEFWSRIAIISLEHFAPLIDHPAAQYVGDISAEIKSQMRHSSEPESSSQDSAA
jgi:hypothetical protein